MECHNIAPIFNSDSTILILGSFPSVLSREVNFYYGNPHNRFWPLMALLFNAELPVTTEEKKNLLLNNHVALWDVIKSCDVKGSGDSTIKNVIPNDIKIIINSCKIKIILCNGRTSFTLFKKYNKENAIYVPSTSPANASCSLLCLEKTWKKYFN